MNLRGERRGDEHCETHRAANCATQHVAYCKRFLHANWVQIEETFRALFRLRFWGLVQNYGPNRFRLSTSGMRAGWLRRAQGRSVQRPEKVGQLTK